MKKAAHILSLLVLFAMLFTLAACGGTDSNTTTDGDHGGDASQDANEDGIEAGASLVYWSMWSETEPQAIALAAAAKAFEQSTGVTVKINFNGRQGQREGIAPALAAGETIDIFDEDMDRVTKQWGDYLLTLDSFVNDNYSDTGGRPYLSLVNGALMNMAKDRGHGTYTVVPYQPFIFTGMYNKNLFSQAGVTSPPKTWDEFLDVCAKLKDNGVTAMTIDNAYIPPLFGYTLTRIVGVDRTLEIFAQPDLSDPGVLRACQILEELNTKGYMSQRAATNIYPEGQASEFGMETVAILICGTWLPNELREINPDLAWGQFAWPSIDAGGAGVEAHNVAAQCFGINKGTSYPNAAFAFIRWMTLGYWDQKLADDSMGVPMANDATWPAEISEAKAILDATTNPFPWAAGAEDDPNIGAAIIDGFQRMATGSIDAQQFASDLAKVQKQD